MRFIHVVIDGLFYGYYRLNAMVV